ERLIAPMRDRMKAALAKFEITTIAASAATLFELRRQLADLLRETADWFAEQAHRHDIRDHSDRLFVELTFLLESRRFQGRTDELMNRTDAGKLDVTMLHAEYRRLARRFDVTLTSFERKRYANLSHEPNKAMNLNSYLGLIPGCSREPRRERRPRPRPPTPPPRRST